MVHLGHLTRAVGGGGGFHSPLENALDPLFSEHNLGLSCTAGPTLPAGRSARHLKLHTLPVCVHNFGGFLWAHTPWICRVCSRFPVWQERKLRNHPLVFIPGRPWTPRLSPPAQAGGSAPWGRPARVAQGHLRRWWPPTGNPHGGGWTEEGPGVGGTDHSP